MERPNVLGYLRQFRDNSFNSATEPTEGGSLRRRFSLSRFEIQSGAVAVSVATTDLDECDGTLDAFLPNVDYALRVTYKDGEGIVAKRPHIVMRKFRDFAELDCSLRGSGYTQILNTSGAVFPTRWLAQLTQRTADQRASLLGIYIQGVANAVPVEICTPLLAFLGIDSALFTKGTKKKPTLPKAAAQHGKGTQGTKKTPTVPKAHHDNGSSSSTLSCCDFDLLIGGGIDDMDLLASGGKEDADDDEDANACPGVPPMQQQQPSCAPTHLRWGLLSCGFGGCVCVFVCMHTHVCVYTHTHTHIYIYIQ
jgi:hypothetical protein